MRRGVAAAVAVATLAGAAISSGAGGAAALQNGSFVSGGGDVPAGWRSEAWSRDGVQFSWTAPAGDTVGSAVIHNAQPNDARWCQSVTVDPGAIYRVIARTRTQDVGTAAAGAHIAIEPRVADSGDVRGTADWQRLEIVARAGDETQWDVCLRLGSYANLNTGSAWFTDVALVQIAPASRIAGPSIVTRTWTWARASGTQALLPLIGGALVAFGLGLGRRHP